jgi:hypothetical protein
MNKRQLIEEIQLLNTSVRTQFLAQFDEAALQQYLTSLQSAQTKRLRMPVWIAQQPKLRMVS